MRTWFSTLPGDGTEDVAGRPPLPFGIALFRAFVVVFVAVVPVEYARTVLPWTWATAVMVAVVAGASWRAGIGAAAAAAGMGWLMLNGFVVHEYGDLGWDGHRDVLRLAALLAAAVSASSTRALVMWIRRPPREVVVPEPPSHQPARVVDQDRV